MFRKNWTLGAIILFVGSMSCAQLKIQRIIDLDYQLRKELFGKGVEVVNITYRGYEHSIAFFKDDSMTIDMPKGILLTSGMALNANGPNYSTGAGSDVAGKGDRDLTKLVGHPTMDAAVLEIEVIPKHKYLSFNYVFASEEYKEYVDKSYNDVFALFIQGAGQREKYNLARIPGTRIPIAIDNVNHLRSSIYYVDNDFDLRNFTDTTLLNETGERPHVPVLKYPSLYHLQYDGFTRVMRALANVRPGETYTVKIAIADVGDRILDSGVFLEAGSFVSHEEPNLKHGVLAESGYYENRFIRDSLRVVARQAEEHEESIEERQQLTPEPVAGEIATLSEVIDTPEQEANLPILFFPFDQSYLTKDAHQKLRSWWDEQPKNKLREIRIEGHTDSHGSDDYNMALGHRRARTVHDTLVSWGYPKSKLTVASHGEFKPSRKNTTAENRAQNRRVLLVP